MKPYDELEMIEQLYVEFEYHRLGFLLQLLIEPILHQSDENNDYPELFLDQIFLGLLLKADHAPYVHP